jgi:hypothetical protein
MQREWDLAKAGGAFISDAKFAVITFLVELIAARR